MKLCMVLCMFVLVVCALSLVTARPHEKRHRHKSEPEVDVNKLGKNKHHKKAHAKKEPLKTDPDGEPQKGVFLDDYMNSYGKYDHYGSKEADSNRATDSVISDISDTSSEDSGVKIEDNADSQIEKSSDKKGKEESNIGKSNYDSNKDWFKYHDNKHDFWDFLDMEDSDYKEYYEKTDPKKKDDNIGNYYQKQKSDSSSESSDVSEHKDKESNERYQDYYKEQKADSSSESSDVSAHKDKESNERYQDYYKKQKADSSFDSSDVSENKDKESDESDDSDDSNKDQSDSSESDESDESDEFDETDEDYSDEESEDNYYDYDDDDADDENIDDEVADNDDSANANSDNLENNELNTPVKFGSSGFDPTLKNENPLYKSEEIESKKTFKGDAFNSYQFVDDDFGKTGNFPEVPRTQPEPRTSPNPPTPVPSKEASTVTPAGKRSNGDGVSDKPVEVPPSPPHHYIQSKPHEYCKFDDDCPPGRMCMDDICVCSDAFMCFGHNNPICGSNGVLYPSHCELHRTACVKGIHIKIDHIGKCYDNQVVAKKTPEISEEKEYDSLTEQNNDKAEYDTKPWVQTEWKKNDDIIMSSKPYDVYEEIPEENKAQSDQQQSCTEDEYIKFKAALLWFHCAKIQEPDCKKDTMEAKGFLATLMFSYYDRNRDGQITKEELYKIQLNDNLETLSKACSLLDMLKFDDVDGIDTSQISSEEFLLAFANVPAIALEEELKIIETMATVGNGLQISCDIKGADDIVWRRHGTDLLELDIAGITVFEDGSLFFENIGTHHTGNFTCHDRTRPSVKQIHHISIQMAPFVKVSPSMQIHYSHSDIMIKCHAEGVPQPQIRWEVNELALPNEPNHFVRTHENGSLVINNADYQRDTGAYKCVAHNSAGNSEDIATIFIKKPDDSQIADFEKDSIKESLIVFHREGYSVYNPEECMTQRLVKASFGNFEYIPDELDEAPIMCKGGEECIWGTAANVKDKFIYVSQPYENRIVVVDVVHTMNPIQVISTDKNPVEVHYIAHLDEVWVICYNTLGTYGTKTIVVIRQASQDIQHHSVHMQPVGNRFDQVEDLFLPPANDLGQDFKHGFVVHNQQRGMFKVDLQGMKYTKALDFGQYDCIPRAVAFVPLGGHLIIKCIKKTETGEVTLQLTMDYISDKVVANRSLFATPYVSPDSRKVVYVDEVSGKVYVNNVLDNGEIHSVFDVTVGTPISDATFFPSMMTKGYDLFLSGYDSGEVYSISLTNGKVTTIKDVDEAYQDLPAPWAKTNRPILSGNIFTEYLASPAQSSVVIINGKLHRVQCKFLGLDYGNVLVFANPILQ